MSSPATIPTYKLYGDNEDWPLPELLHCEAIATRSAVHDWRIRPHRHHDLYQLLFCHRGAVRIELDGTSRSLAGPYLVAVPPLCVHGFEFEVAAAGWVVTLPVFALKRFFEAEARLEEPFGRPHVLEIENAEDGVHLKRVFGRLAEEFQGDGPARLMALEAYLSLVVVWVARSVLASAGDQRPGGDRGAGRVRRFQKLVERSFRDWRSVQDYAAELGVTAAQLNNTCRALAGKSALQVVHDRVLIEAKRNLVYTDMTVSEVSYSLGFSDPAYFTRFFKKRVGCPPTVFREAKRSVGDP